MLLKLYRLIYEMKNGLLFSIAEKMLLPATAERARQLNEKYYFTNHPCKRGHTDVRYASSSNCARCMELKKARVFCKTRNTFRISEENRDLALEAINSGKSTFTPINPCRHGHFNRYVTNGNCADCDAIKRAYIKKHRKWRRIEKIYGINEMEFNELLLKQGKKCLICVNDLTEKNSHIDHCHSKGHIRGILCNKCNQGIGLFSDSVENLRRAVKYIENDRA